MESPENIWQFSRPATDAQGTSSFLVPTQYDDYCSQASNLQSQDKLQESMQRSKTQSSSANDVESQSRQDTLMMHPIEGNNTEYEPIHSVESFSSLATVQDQAIPQQGNATTSSLADKSETHGRSEEDLQPQTIDAWQPPQEPARVESLKTMGGGSMMTAHTLPGLVSFEPLVAYIDPRSQTIPYNNSTTPSYQNSFYYQCMPPPPPIMYPSSFPTYINHQTIAVASKADTYHLQSIPLHQQDSRAKPRHFWSEDDSFKVRPEFDIYHGQPLLDNYTYMPHKNDRFDAHTMLHAKNNPVLSDLTRGNGLARKRQKPVPDSSYDHNDLISREGSTFAGKTSTTIHKRKANCPNIGTSRGLSESSPCAKAGLAAQEAVDPVTPQNRDANAARSSYQIKKHHSNCVIDPDSVLAMLQPPQASEDVSSHRLSASNIGFGVGLHDDDNRLNLSASHAISNSDLQNVGTFACMIKDELEEGTIVKQEDLSFQGLPKSAQSSLTTGGIGVVEWQKECHKFDKESKTKIIMHDSSNRRDCSPRRSRRVSYNYSDSELSPVPSASLGSDSIDRDDSELKVKEAASTKWTEDDNTRLVRLRANGSSWPDLANALGRSKRACQLKYVQLTKQAPYFFLGHPKKLEHLMQLYEERKDSLWNDIALELGCLPRVAEEKVFELMRER